MNRLRTIFPAGLGRPTSCPLRAQQLDSKHLRLANPVVDLAMIDKIQILNDMTLGRVASLVRQRCEIRKLRHDSNRYRNRSENAGSSMVGPFGPFSASLTAFGMGSPHTLCAGRMLTTYKPGAQ